MADERARDGGDAAALALGGVGDFPGDGDGLSSFGHASVDFAVEDFEQFGAALIPHCGRGDGASVGHDEQGRHGRGGGGLALVVVGEVARGAAVGVEASRGAGAQG